MKDDFDGFYRSTSRRTLRYAYAICGDATTAQDLTQEAYVRAWQRWRVVGGYAQPDAWVRLVVARLATDRWRRLGLRRRFESGLAGAPPPVGPPSEDTVVLTAAMRRLPMRHRQAVALHYLLDQPVHDIAVELGASEATVRSWLARGRAALAAILRPIDEESSHVR